MMQCLQIAAYLKPIKVWPLGLSRTSSSVIYGSLRNTDDWSAPAGIFRNQLPTLVFRWKDVKDWFAQQYFGSICQFFDLIFIFCLNTCIVCSAFLFTSSIRAQNQTHVSCQTLEWKARPPLTLTPRWKAWREGESICIQSIIVWFPPRECRMRERGRRKRGGGRTNNRFN